MPEQTERGPKEEWLDKMKIGELVKLDWRFVPSRHGQQKSWSISVWDAQMGKYTNIAVIYESEQLANAVMAMPLIMLALSKSIDAFTALVRKKILSDSILKIIEAATDPLLEALKKVRDGDA